MNSYSISDCFISVGFLLQQSKKKTIPDWIDVANEFVGKTRQFIGEVNCCATGSIMPSFVRPRGASTFGLGSCGLGESYFDAEGDDDVSKAERAPPLSWRGDPLQTHSDWTIIVATSEFDSRTYHVHKSILRQERLRTSLNRSRPVHH